MIALVRLSVCNEAARWATIDTKPTKHRRAVEECRYSNYGVRFEQAQGVLPGAALERQQCNAPRARLSHRLKSENASD
ncbi:NusG antitermination factor [Anopheles sinensis]|uniref:NusG antitermination factor n=1 Tax=Anopheles sinensis TaxID=74873 RepID=A0A084WI36_ANOSI|nr:NusG antitermination factor [Anopheles sinensis]